MNTFNKGFSEEIGKIAGWEAPVELAGKALKWGGEALKDTGIGKTLASKAEQFGGMATADAAKLGKQWAMKAGKTVGGLVAANYVVNKKIQNNNNRFGG